MPKQCLEGSGDLFGFNNVFTSVSLHQRLVFSLFGLSTNNVITRDSVNFPSPVEVSSGVVIHACIHIM